MTGRNQLKIIGTLIAVPLLLAGILLTTSLLPDRPAIQTAPQTTSPSTSNPAMKAGWDLSLPSLAATYRDSFLLGNIASTGAQINADNTAMFTYHYNVMTAENLMKPQNLSPSKGVYNYLNADTLIDWAFRNNIQVHGHVLVWHSQSAAWLNKTSAGAPLTRSEARQNMQDYIDNVAGHFAGKVLSWDVVNEAFDGGSLPFASWKDVTRKTSPWYLAYANGADTANGESGADYIYDAFVFARLADPNAILYFNDYNETDGWKREAMASMAEELNALWLADPRNTDPGRKLVEGLGMQSHYYTEYPPVASIASTIQRFIRAGVRISVSELDVSYGRYNGPQTQVLTQEQEVTQAIYYARLFEFYKAYDAHIQRVTLWGHSDSTSWRTDYAPMPFDRALAPKEAYDAILDPSAYLAAHGQTPRPLHDLTVSAGGTAADPAANGRPALITVRAAGTGLGGYKAVAYLEKDGVRHSDEITLVDGVATIPLAGVSSAGAYRVLIDVYDGTTLHASKEIPLTVGIRDGIAYLEKG